MTKLSFSWISAIYLIILVIGCTNSNSSKDDSKLERTSTDTVHIPIDLKQDTTRNDSASAKLNNQVTEIYVTKYTMPRVDLPPNGSKSFVLDFDNHDPNGQYTILAVSLTSLSGNGSAQIMNSLTPVINGYTNLWLHNPHSYERGQTMDFTFVIFFRRNY